ncbi:SDR family oxidoreductase [Actinacidiphila acididurans]|uniref:SDR family oxidoreductase n=1 Tax=Actinacidiphila acididurans TaxID=2784346 RepID=A0ABS2U2N2_9ACTN|nr:SDR family oxidoreductase [Actinacidiphila acididurans]MBM9509476.1 SDR family oxidoreductase [Actinacidiphila acididurans]
MTSVLITGASRGIGRATAAEFARRGHRVVATARDPRSLTGLDVDQRLALDVTDEASVAAAVQEAGEIDVLISNAGAIFFAAVEATPAQQAAELFDLNTLGSLRVAQAVLPGMRARGRGRLLFVSSVVGRIVLPPGAAYQATKWALEALVEALAIEVAPFGLEAALLEPGAVSSGALDDVAHYALADDPYRAIAVPGADSGGMTGAITPQQAAVEIADAAEASPLPLRLPIGDAARAILAARREAPDTVPFVPGQPAAATGDRA